MPESQEIQTLADSGVLVSIEASTERILGNLWVPGLTLPLMSSRFLPIPDALAGSPSALTMASGEATMSAIPGAGSVRRSPNWVSGRWHVIPGIQIRSLPATSHARSIAVLMMDLLGISYLWRWSFKRSQIIRTFLI